MFRHLPAVKISFHLSAVLLPYCGIFQICPVKADCQSNLVRHKPFFQQSKSKHICHLFYNQLRLFVFIRALQHLPGTYAVVARLIRFHVCNRAGLPTPGMVNEELRIHPEQLIKQFFIVEIICPAVGTPRDIPHSIQPMFLQFFGIPPADPPEIRKRAVVPKHMAVTRFVQFRNPRAVFVRFGVLSHNVHCNLAKVQICADADGRCNACCFQNIKNNRSGKLARRLPVKIKIIRHIYKHLVNRVNMDILWLNIFQVNLVNVGVASNVVRHTRDSDNIIQLQLRRFRQCVPVAGFPLENMIRGMAQTFPVDFLHPPHHLKQTRPPRYAVGFQRGRDSKTNGFVCTALICNNKICRHRVKPPFQAFHRSIKRFAVNRDIKAFFSVHTNPLSQKIQPQTKNVYSYIF